MPKALEQRLAREARAKHLTGKRRDAYIYGTLSKVKREQAGKRKRPAAKSRRKK